MDVDFIIVGQGIAGTVLADHLMAVGKNVLVFDEPSLSNSSRVAGGLYNPITGRKMVKTWLADELFENIDWCSPTVIFRNLVKALYVNFKI